MDYNKLHKELKFRASRSSGSGGQHVNKVSTRMELLFDVKASDVLETEEKEMISKHLGNRINKEGILLIASEKSRSQLLNRNAALKKFDKLIAEALNAKEDTRNAGAFKSNKKKRLHAKKHRSEKKAWRKKVDPNTGKGLF